MLAKMDQIWSRVWLPNGKLKFHQYCIITICKLAIYWIYILHVCHSEYSQIRFYDCGSDLIWQSLTIVETIFQTSISIIIIYLYLSIIADVGSTSAGVVYTRWGRKQCSGDAKLIYEGDDDCCNSQSQLHWQAFEKHLYWISIIKKLCSNGSLKVYKQLYHGHHKSYWIFVQCWLDTGEISASRGQLRLSA
mgnify:CR=1 FL=1